MGVQDQSLVIGNIFNSRFEIDVGELQLRLELGAGVGGGERQRALKDAAECLRLTDGHEQLAAAQIGGDGGASETGAAQRDVCRR